MCPNAKQKKKRISWQETREVGGEKMIFFVLAERDEAGNWQFSERDAYDVRWHPIASTPERVARAEQKIAKP